MRKIRDTSRKDKEEDFTQRLTTGYSGLPLSSIYLCKSIREGREAATIPVAWLSLANEHNEKEGGVLLEEEVTKWCLLKYCLEREELPVDISISVLMPLFFGEIFLSTEYERRSISANGRILYHVYKDSVNLYQPLLFVMLKLLETGHTKMAFIYKGGLRRICRNNDCVEIRYTNSQFQLYVDTWRLYYSDSMLLTPLHTLLDTWPGSEI